MSLFDTSHSYSNVPDQKDFLLQAHARYEILLFIKGNSKFNVEGNIYQLKKGDLVLVGPAESHYIYLDSLAPYERIVIEFYPSVLDRFECKDELLAVFHDRPLGKFNHYSAAMFPDNKWAYLIENCNSAKTDEKKLCFLLPLLLDLNFCFNVIKNLPEKQTDFWQNDIAFPIIEYINKNLTTHLSLESICNHFFINKNQLNRIIKKATNTTVWKYITTKRLIYANELLYKGNPPLKVCELCGFTDYPTFYKAYKKHFSRSPSNDYVKRHT